MAQTWGPRRRVAEHFALRVLPIADRQTEDRIKAAAGIALDSVVDDPALATIEVIGDRRAGIGQHAAVATPVIGGREDGIGVAIVFVSPLA